ncbi:MAG: hypothetical protein V4709_08300 [Pseudomonadota bacterium]
MKRIFGSFVASCLLLAGCGGGLQSPDFEPVLKNVAITFTPAAGTSAATTAPGSTFQFIAVGLYSTPPGTGSGTGLVSCMVPTEPTAVCSTGAVSGVTWSVDPTTATAPIASIDNTGLATGLRRGSATVRAKVQSFEDTQSLLVSGAVLSSFTISATPDEVVPTGRSITLTATAACTDNSGPATCIKDYTAYSWSLPSNFPANTVTFSPSPATGKIIVAKTNRFGAFSIDAVITNEEGDRITSSVALNATLRVLDDIVVSADPAVAAPVPLIKGTRTRFIARGVFSDGTTGEILSTDLGGNNKLTWSRDASSIGQYTIDDSAAAPTTAVIATVAADALVGANGLTARGTNTETPALALEDRIALDIREVGLIAVTKICLNADLGSTCSSNVQIPLNETYLFKARGTFQGDAAGVERDIDPALLPLTWGKTPASTNITVATTTGSDPGKGSVTGNAQGVSTINVALNAGIAVTVADRDESASVTVVDQDCRDQLLLSNGAAATSDDDTPNDGGNVQNAGNVIDPDPATFGRFNVVVGGGAEETLSMIFRRDANVITPSASGGRNVGLLLAYDSDVILSDIFTLRTVNATGATVQSFSGLQPTTVTRGSQTLYYYTANATMPFSGLRIEATLPPFSPADILTNPTGLLDAIQALLGGGGSAEVDVFTACADVNAAAPAAP